MMDQDKIDEGVIALEGILKHAIPADTSMHVVIETLTIMLAHTIVFVSNDPQVTAKIVSDCLQGTVDDLIEIAAEEKQLN